MAMSSTRTLTVWIAALATAVPALAGPDGNAEFSAEVRWRPESSRAELASGTSTETVQLLRTRLNASFTASENTSAFVQLQDARTLGQTNDTGGPTSGSVSETSDLGVHQAYLQINELFNPNFGLQAGRFEMNYGNQRLIGGVGWSQFGRAFDGARITARQEAWSADFIMAKLVERMGDVSGNEDVDLYGIYSTFHQMNADMFLLFDYDKRKIAEERQMKRWTAGTYTKQPVGENMDVTVNGAFQFGSVAADDSLGGAMTMDLSAFMATVEFGYNPMQSSRSESGFTRMAAGVDYTSGNDPDSDSWNAFDNLYYTDHNFRGMMDQFTFSPSTGLMDLYLSGSFSPAPDWSMTAAAHNFTTPQDFPSMMDGEAASSLGNEFDLVISNSSLENVSIEAGGAAFLATEDFAGPDPDTEFWGFLQVSVGLQ